MSSIFSLGGRGYGEGGNGGRVLGGGIYCKGIFTKDYKKTIGVYFLERKIE